MDQIQRWTYDYVSKFVKLDPKAAKKMREQLIKECELTTEEAAEIVNIRPTALAELRSFTFGRATPERPAFRTSRFGYGP